MVRKVTGGSETVIPTTSSAITIAITDGSWNSTLQYTAFGEVRVSKGITSMKYSQGTRYCYTGQLAQDVLGLDYYVARWYDPQLNHFISADTIVSVAIAIIGFTLYKSQFP